MDNIRKYSPKENLAIVIIAYRRIRNKEFDEFTKSLESVLNDEFSKEELLSKIDYHYISKIENYWQLTNTQVLSYGYIIANHFRVSKEEITIDTITDTFIYNMKLYSPDNAVDFVKRNFNADIEVINNE